MTLQLKYPQDAPLLLLKLSSQIIKIYISKTFVTVNYV